MISHSGIAIDRNRWPKYPLDERHREELRHRYKRSRHWLKRSTPHSAKEVSRVRWDVDRRVGSAGSQSHRIARCHSSGSRYMKIHSAFRSGQSVDQQAKRVEENQ